MMPIFKKWIFAAAGDRSFEMSDRREVGLGALLEVGGVWEMLVARLGGSRVGVLGLRALLGSCCALWRRHWDMETGAMGGQPWGLGHEGHPLRRAAKLRHFWASASPVQCNVGFGDGWCSAYAFAVGASGYAVLGRTPNLASTTARCVSMWYRDASGATGRSIPGCKQGHDLVIGHADPRGVDPNA